MVAGEAGVLHGLRGPAALSDETMAAIGAEAIAAVGPRAICNPWVSPTTAARA